MTFITDWSVTRETKRQSGIYQRSPRDSQVRAS